MEMLSFFTLNKAKTLLTKLNKKTRNFYIEQEGHIFRSCLPSVFSVNIEYVRHVRGGEDKFIVKALHLRDDLFILAYANKEIVIKNLATEEKISSFQLEGDGFLTDIDVFRGNES